MKLKVNKKVSAAGYFLLSYGRSSDRTYVSLRFLPANYWQSPGKQLAELRKDCHWPLCSIIPNKIEQMMMTRMK